MDTNNKVDQEMLIDQFLKGDFDAFSELYWQYHKSVYSKAYRLLVSKSEAEEVVLDVFVDLWNHKSLISDIRSFQMQLGSLTDRCIFSLLKRKVNEKVLQLEPEWN
jgi:DNA-directed RNA polymerase specialized sigma24 family protein